MTDEYVLDDTSQEKKTLLSDLLEKAKEIKNE